MRTADSKKRGAVNSDDSSIVHWLMPHHLHHRKCTPTGEAQNSPQNDSHKEHNFKDRAYHRTISTYAPPPDPPPAPPEK